ncbi:CAAX prenyl protease-like protein [Ureibacillus xyleni]|uniref:CAAX prenyl protease-like protein n=1 Tax=Ureibacillus xyleni TaxID=614648 RepID=A0A285T3H3_9BACL|nr:CAAX prenyl protease-like protein [Ureibacillus xyleni]
MANVSRILLIAIVLMTLISFSNFFGINIAGLSVIIGILFYFIDRKLNNDSRDALKLVGTQLKDKTIWLWIFSPLVMNVLCFVLASLFLPEFIKHTYERTQFALTADKLLLLIFQLALFALGEEIAWRGFFQRNLVKVLPIAPTVIITSILFSIGHFTFGQMTIVSFDLFFIFMNSVLYGIVFYKTNHVWMSALSHFIANLFAFIVILLL